ncbi:EthD family reductase [Pseudonocardia sichuanensis]
MTILYGTPTDPAAFRSYYTDTHVPIARKMRGLTGWNLQWLDGNPDYILVAELYAEDEAAMNAILASPEGVAASADLENFVTGGVTFLTGEEEQVALS